MIRAGLYAAGADPRLDEAVKLFPQLDDFMTRRTAGVAESFVELAAALRIQGNARQSTRMNSHSI